MPFLRAALLKKERLAREKAVEAVAEVIAVEESPGVEVVTESVVVAEIVPESETVIEITGQVETESEPKIVEAESELPSEIETVPEIIDEAEPESVTEITEPESESPDIETIPASEPESIPDTETLTEGSPENVAEEFTLADESVHAPESNGYSPDVLALQEEESPDTETGSDGAVEETSPEIQPEEQALEPDTQLPPEIAEALAEQEPESEPDTPQSQPQKDYSGSQLNYDFTSGERYVDTVSTKTEFDKMLDELSAISKDLIDWQTEKFARDYTGRFQDGDSSVADARKYEAFLGGYITNAAMLLYDKGYKDAAIKQLEQAISILQARKKLEDETLAIKSSVEEHNDTVDLSDILGLFGDG